ncbi:MAG: hypothetical protein CSA60_02050 [Neptuniibacter caesariensis]|uniref:Lipoprotein n=1 Tax=Neptuniibacter caesariensis TaxID=207954 RepID=A0A2G6JPG5_NEPCE|nr:MAG: hypothetical protein CSA60_02050 [Neptuniibacter caesariensis]
MSRVFLTLLIFVGLSGCQSIPKNPGEGSELLFRRGIISQSEQGLIFKPCYVSKKELISDDTGKLKKRLSRQLEPTVYVELSGDSMTPGAPWRVRQVHLMGGSEVTCGYELPGNDYRAAGEKPVWVADIKEHTIHVRSYGRLAQLIFPRNEPISLGNGWEWHSELSGTGSYSLSLKLLDRVCRDHYGVEYEYSSEMVLNGQLFSGCAREGSLDLRSIPGLYSSLQSGPNGTSRFVTLDISGDGEAILKQDYRNRQPIIVQKGTWRKIATGKLVIHLTELDGRAESDVLIFERDQRGRLVLKGYNATYGSSGLKLERLGPERKYRKLTR